MSYGLDDAMSAVTEHPYIAAGAVVVGILLMSRGGGGGTPDNSGSLAASLQSLQISSDTNVQLAGIQAQRDAIALQANRDIALGAQQVAINDRQASVVSAANYMQSSAATAQAVSANSLAGFQSALGFTATLKDLANQRLALDYNSNAQFAGMNVQLADIAANKDISTQSISAARDLGISQINADVDVAKYSLPFQERMYHDSQETERSGQFYAYQSVKKAAKAQSGGLLGQITNLFSGISSSIGNIAGLFGKGAA